MEALAYCKYSNCEGAIDADMVRKLVAIPKAPNHVALVATCGACGRAGQYVIERSIFDAQKDLAPQEERYDAAIEKAVTAARIELDAVDNVYELQALWASLKDPPLFETGKPCDCADCIRKRYGKRQ
jgi:hypothetical protein